MLKQASSLSVSRSGSEKDPFGSISADCGDGWRNFEPMVSRKTVSFTRIDKIIRELRRLYKENPAYFNVPNFAQKVY